MCLVGERLEVYGVSGCDMKLVGEEMRYMQAAKVAETIDCHCVRLGSMVGSIGL